MTRRITRLPIGDHRQDYHVRYLCPRCGVRELPDGYPGALSRADNATELCSPCGNEEAFEDMYGRATPTNLWPIKQEHHP